MVMAANSGLILKFGNWKLVSWLAASRVDLDFRPKKRIFRLKLDFFPHIPDRLHSV